MSDHDALFDGELVLSRHLDYFRNGDEFFVYHNLYGYILKMSEDVLHFLEFFRTEPRVSAETAEAFKGEFAEESLSEFANVFAMQRCLMPPDEPEESKLLSYYPVHARWTVYHQPESGPVTLYAFDYSTQTQVVVAQLNEWDSELWRKITGEITCAQLIEEMRSVEGSPVTGLDAQVFATLEKFTHCDMQIIKMSPKAASGFRGRRHGTPPYLISSMPYEKITTAFRGGEADLRVGVPGLERQPIAEELLTDDRISNTLAVYFREPHAALKNQGYAARLLDTLTEAELHTSQPSILDVSGGSGAFTAAFFNALKAKEIEPGRYVVLAANEEDAGRIRETLQAAGVLDHIEVQVGDVVATLKSLVKADARFDLVVSDEMAAHLETIPVRKVTPGAVPEEDEETGEAKETNGHGKRDVFIAEGDAVGMIFRLDLPLQDSAPDFFLNIGAIAFVEQALKLLSDQGQLVLIEFGELYRYPVRAAQDDNPQYSLHFGHLVHVAKHMGFETDFGYLMEKLDFDRDMQMLATTRSQFKVLRHMLARFGVSLERRAYSQDEIQALLAKHDVDLNVANDFTFEPLEDRILGVVTHSYKMLRVFRPTTIEL